MLGEADVILHLGYKNCRSKAFPSKNICLAGGKTRDHQTLGIDIAFRESLNKILQHVLLRPPSWPSFVALPFEYEGLRAVAMAADYMKDISIWRKRNMKE